MNALLGQTEAEVKLLLRDKTLLLFSLFFPVITVAFFGYLNRDGRVGEDSYSSFLIAGGIGMIVSSTAFQSLSAALARQRDAGILKRLGGTPLRISTLVSAKVLVAAAAILAQAAIMVAVTVLLFKAELSGSPFWTLMVLVLGVAAFCALGIALAGLCPTADAASAAGLAVALPMQFLCGTLFPIEEMPPALRHLAQALPLTYFVNALRGAMLTGGGPAEYAIDWMILMGCLAGAFVVAIKVFRWE
jgi:ABC-2 type transport system permease protein